MPTYIVGFIKGSNRASDECYSVDMLDPSAMNVLLEWLSPNPWSGTDANLMAKVRLNQKLTQLPPDGRITTVGGREVSKLVSDGPLPKSKDIYREQSTNSPESETLIIAFDYDSPECTTGYINDPDDMDSLLEKLSPDPWSGTDENEASKKQIMTALLDLPLGIRKKVGYGMVVKVKEG